MQLQGRIDELENHIQRLENEREAREQEARAVVREPPADDQEYWERMVEEVLVQEQGDEDLQDMNDPDDPDQKTTLRTERIWKGSAMQTTKLSNVVN